MAEVIGATGEPVVAGIVGDQEVVIPVAVAVIPADVAQGLAVPSPRADGAAGRDYTVPGVTPSSTSVAAMTANLPVFDPILVTSPRVFDRVAVEVFSAAGNTRVAIYTADPNWQPDTLVADLGVIATTSTGLRAATINLELDPGAYMAVVISSGAPSLRRVDAIPPWGVALGTEGVNPYRIPATVDLHTGIMAGGFPADAGNAGLSWERALYAGTPAIPYHVRFREAA